MRAIRRAQVRLARRRGDEGMTLVELMVAIVLLGVVSALVSSAVVQAQRLFVRNDDEGRGLADAKIVLERLGRDVRESRGVLCDGGLADVSDPSSADPACAAHLQLWVDDNSDYLQQQSEVVTWRLRKSPDGTHFDVLRIQGSGLSGNVPVTETLATSLIVRTLFTYDTAVPQNARLVNVSMKYDAIVGVGSDIREAVFSARLRNKG